MTRARAAFAGDTILFEPMSQQVTFVWYRAAADNRLRFLGRKSVASAALKKLGVPFTSEETAIIANANIDYAHARDQLVDDVAAAGPKKALEELNGWSTSDDRLASNCHALTHEIGHAAAATNERTAKLLTQGADICGAGYIHGVIEARLANSTDIAADLRTICAAGDGYCWHGVGHGVMFFTKDDIKKSMQLCNVPASANARRRCPEGVFMELFGGDLSLHKESFPPASDPLLPCRSTSAAGKPACYFYAARFFTRVHAIDANLFTFCEKAEPVFRPACAMGIGSALLKQHLNSPSLIERTCDAAPGAEHNYCIQGMVSYQLVNFNSKKGEELCDILEPKNRPICRTAINQRIGIFAK